MGVSQFTFAEPRPHHLWTATQHFQALSCSCINPRQCSGRCWSDWYPWAWSPQWGNNVFTMMFFTANIYLSHFKGIFYSVLFEHDIWSFHETKHEFDFVIRNLPGFEAKHSISNFASLMSNTSLDDRLDKTRFWSIVAGWQLHGDLGEASRNENIVVFVPQVDWSRRRHALPSSEHFWKSSRWYRDSPSF